MLSLILQGLRWLASTAQSQFFRRPSDFFIGLILASLTVYFWVGPDGWLSTLADIAVTATLMYGVWWLVQKVSDWAENSVFRLPDDERTREAQRQIDQMIDEALD